MSTHNRILHHIKVNQLKGKSLQEKEKLLNKIIIESNEYCIERLKEDLEDNKRTK